MFDTCFPHAPTAANEAVRAFFLSHGRDLAEAALILGGPGAEGRVKRCAAHVMSVTSLDARTRRELTAFHRMLTLEDAPGPEDLDWWLFPDLDPASPSVVRICRVTDRLIDMLAAISSEKDSRRRHDPTDSGRFIQA